MEEMELSDYINEHEFRGLKQTETNKTEQSDRRLLRIGLLTLGVICIIQAALNFSLHLAFYSKEDTDQFPLNSSVIKELCQIDQSQQNSTQFCSCCNKLLRRLIRENTALERDRDRLQDMVGQRSRDYIEESGSGFLDGFYSSE